MAVKTDPSRTACSKPLDFARDGQSRMACVVSLLSVFDPEAQTRRAGAADRLSMNLVRVGSGYEAAAELLSGPVSALLVDLSILTPAHAGLLKLAARLDVPVVAFGTVSASLDGSALAGVRLVGAEDVPDALREIMTVKPTSELPTGQFVAAIEETNPSIAEKEPIKVSVPLIAKPLTRDELDALLRD